MTTSLDQNYWNERWINNKTSWDMGGVAPIVYEYFKNIDNKDIKILIPGCGNAHEAKVLLRLGFSNITLLDIAPTLVESLARWFEGDDRVEVIEADFFDWEGQYDLIFEQTFFCALEPSLRTSYVEKVALLLNAEGILVGLLFNRTFEKTGPPFGGSLEEYEVLFQNHFEYIRLEESKGSIPPRAGTELFIEFKKNIK